MESGTILDISLVHRILPHIAASLRPSSISDIAALVLLLFLSGAYLLRGIAWDKPDPYYHLYFEKPQQQDGGARQQQETRNIAQKLDESNKNCVVFWGSQSGTAEGFANRLARECRLRFSLSTMTADLSDYDPETIALIPESKLVIFILSTYGEGDPSDNTAGFWDWICHAQNPPLKSVRCAAFGLGNSNYKYYNQVVTVVTQKLGALGAKQLLPTGRADDALRTTEEDFVTWKTNLFQMFKQDLQFEEKSAGYEAMFEVVEDHSLDLIDLHLGEQVHPRDNPRAATSSSPIKPMQIKETRELFTSGDRNCVHLELEITEHEELRYKTGDHLAVWPVNGEEEVARLLTVLGAHDRKDAPILLRSLDATARLKVPSPTTLAALFGHYLDISAPVSREAVLALTQFAPSAEARSFLLNLGQHRDRYAAFTSQNHLTLGRLLALAEPTNPASWSQLPMSFVIETLAPMQPRFYSISSSSVLSPRRIAITALVSVDGLQAPSSGNSPRVHGLTTNYLLAHSRALSTFHPSSSPSPAYTIPSPHIHAHIRKSKFKLPVSPLTPLVMVAAGTGLAPFRAFVSERAKLYTTRGRDNVGEMALFFGCRNEAEDWIYREEIEKCREKMGGKMTMAVGFSRPGGSAKGQYVQDLIPQAHNASEMLRLLDDGANFYICGRTQMAREVTRAVVGVVQAHKGMSEEEAWEYVEGMKRRGKWKEDVWG